MGAPDNLPLTASLQVTPELLDGLKKESTALEDAQAYVIDSQEMAVIVNGNLQDVKRRLKVVEEWDERFAAPIRQLEETRTALFGPAKKALLAAEAHSKTLLKDWTEKERVRVAAENRAREDAARRAREQAERDAAAARARAEEAARKARQEAEAAEAERRRQEAEAVRLREAGDKKAAADAERKAQAAAAEKAKREEEERQRQAEGERKAAEIQMAAAAAAEAAPAVAAPQKLAGYSERKNWVAELDDDTTVDQALEKVICAIAGVEKCTGRRDLMSLTTLDMKQANKWAKAQESKFSVPGLKSRNAPISSSKG